MYLNRSKMYMPCGHLPPLIAAAEKVSYTKFLCIKPLISTSGGRFPWATPQLRANRMLVMKALRQDVAVLAFQPYTPRPRSEEPTSELESRGHVASRRRAGDNSDTRKREGLT